MRPCGRQSGRFCSAHSAASVEGLLMPRSTPGCDESDFAFGGDEGRDGARNRGLGPTPRRDHPECLSGTARLRWRVVLCVRAHLIGERPNQSGRTSARSGQAVRLGCAISRWARQDSNLRLTDHETPGSSASWLSQAPIWEPLLLLNGRVGPGTHWLVLAARQRVVIGRTLCDLRLSPWPRTQERRTCTIRFAKSTYEGHHPRGPSRL
jgi:hypothetical protein